MKSYQLEKLVWSDSDYSMMGWHDATIWSMTANPDDYEFLLDLDYIFNWVHPKEGEIYFKFWIAPVTMVFENVDSINISLQSNDGSIEVADLYRENPKPTPTGEFIQYRYRFDCQEGDISLTSTGFKLFVRQAPQLSDVQFLKPNRRGGVCFARNFMSS